MYNFSKTFFSKTKAESFVKYLAANNAEDITVWTCLDGFNQTQYSVRWN